MPLPKGTKYRFRKLKNGKEQRLAFHGGKVTEVANYNAMHKKTGTTMLTSKK